MVEQRRVQVRRDHAAVWCRRIVPYVAENWRAQRSQATVAMNVEEENKANLSCLLDSEA
jgi:hypothetical protein